MIGIYKITSPKGNVYIGQSIDINKRFSSYKYRLAPEQPKLHRSFKKYGFENHTFETIIECELHELNDKERYYQEIYNCLGVKGLNLCYVNASDRNGKHSEETKAKISKNNAKNRLGLKLTDEQKEHLRQVNLGKKQSEESKLKRSKTTKGRAGKPLTEEAKRKLREFNLGKKHSEATKLKMRESQSKIPYEVKLKQMASLLEYSKNNDWKTGVKLSKERIHNMKKGMSKLIILDQMTGVFYFSITEAAIAYNIKNSTMGRYLNGKSKNKTNLIKL